VEYSGVQVMKKEFFISWNDKFKVRDKKKLNCTLFEVKIRVQKQNNTR